MTAYRYFTASSLDGYIATADDSLDWLLSQPIDAAGPMNYEEFIGDIGAIVMGATTCAWILEHEESGPRPWPYAQPSFVLTHRDLTPPADGVAVVSGDVAALRTRLEEAAAGKDVWIVGGGDLAAQFARAGMLDEVLISYAPVMLGAGRPLFPDRLDLELVELARNEAFACARYAVADRPGASGS